MILTARSSVAALAVVAALAGCGDGSESTGDGQTPTSSIVATTTIWADITSATLCGLDVSSVIPTGADPHTYETSLRDRETLEQADVVVANGGGLEDSLTDLLSVIETNGTTVIEVMTRVDPLEPADEADHDDDGHDDDGHDADGGDVRDHRIDPHIWQDPQRVISALPTIAGARQDDQPDCVDGYRAELEELDGEIAGMLAAIPAADRVMVTSHDSLAYFADRYDFEIVGTVIPSTNTLAQTNAADLADLAETIERRGVTAIFTEQLESTADAEALAERLDVRVVPLVTDALTDDAPTYIEMMRGNATSIAEALTP